MNNLQKKLDDEWQEKMDILEGQLEQKDKQLNLKNAEAESFMEQVAGHKADLTRFETELKQLR